MIKKASLNYHFRINKITLRNGREYFRVEFKVRGDWFWWMGQMYSKQFPTEEEAVKFMEEKIKEDNEKDHVIIKTEIIDLK